MSEEKKVNMWDENALRRQTIGNLKDQITALQSELQHSNDTIDELMNELAQLKAAQEWRDISTAPRGSGEDGPDNVTHPDYIKPPELLLFTSDGLHVGNYDWHYHEGYGYGWEPGLSPWVNSSGCHIYPTHWMPLPITPPQTEPESNDD